jgi:eukaryotic-like serine/threonine-protein kinase
METESIVHTCPHCGTRLDVSEIAPFTEVDCPTCGKTIRVRDQFDHFQITEFIASGGMGSVYRANDINLNRVVALKLLRKEYNDDKEYIQKLETEAKITASVTHPYVVKVFSFGCDQGVYYIAMELVDKGSLDDLMGLQGRVAEAQVLEIGLQVAQGLRAAFRVGLIHRDVKPGNILFADAHTAKIVDFGLAMPLEQAAEGEEEIWGTPYYVAPENLNHEPEDFRSDIYSLGGTLFHALAGRPPFEAQNASLVALKHLKNQVVSLQAFAPDVSSPTAYVINRMQAKNPNDRYASYDELIEHLEYARNELLGNAGKTRQQKARVVVEDEKQNAIFGYIIFAAIAVLMMIGGTLYYFRNSIISSHSGAEELAKQQMARSVESAEQVLAYSRKQMIAGKADVAAAAVCTLESRQSLPDALRPWVPLHTVAAELQAGQSQTAREVIPAALAKKSFAGADRAEQERALKVLTTLGGVLRTRSKSALDSTITKWTTGTYEPFGLYICAMKEWDAARFDNADMFFQKFIDSKPSVPWVEEFKPLAQKYRDDFAQYKTLRDTIKNAASPDQKKAAIKVAKKLRSKAQTQGRLASELAVTIDALQNSLSPATPPKLTSVKALKADVNQRLTEMQPAQASSDIEAAKLAGKDAEAAAALKKKVAFIADLKKRMIDNLNGNPINRSLTQRNGAFYSGRISKADDSGVQFMYPVNVIPWSDIMPSSILVWADSIPSTSAERLWLAGAYASVAGLPKEAKERLDPAAAQNKDYAASLPLFQGK